MSISNNDLNRLTVMLSNKIKLLADLVLIEQNYNNKKTVSFYIYSSIIMLVVIQLKVKLYLKVLQ